MLLNATRVLIVEDDLSRAERAATLLTAAGYFAQNAYNVGDALYALENGRFDVALINSAMRDQAGSTLQEQIENDPRFRRLPQVTIDPATPISDEELLRHVAQAMRIRNRATGELPALEADPHPTRPHLPRSAESIAAANALSDNQQLAELKTLSALSRSLSSSLDLSEVLNQIVDAATSLTNAEEGMLLLPDEAGTALYTRAMKGLDSESAQNFRIKTDDTLAGRVFTTGEPVLVGARGWQKVKTQYFVRSLLYVPLSYKGQVIGVLGVDNKRAERVFTTHDQELLLDLAAHAATALANARLYESQVLQTRQLATLVDAGRAVNSTLALNGVLSRICQQLVRALDVSGCLISEVTPGSANLRMLAAARRAAWRPANGPLLDLDSRPTLKAALDQNVYYVISRERTESNWLAERDVLAQNGAQEIVVLPLRPGGQAVGVLELHYLDHAPETSADYRRLARALSLEIIASASQRTEFAPADPSFVRAQTLLAQTGADWCTIWLITPQRELARIMEYGEAVWLDTIRPEQVLFPPTLDTFAGSDTGHGAGSDTGHGAGSNTGNSAGSDTENGAGSDTGNNLPSDSPRTYTAHDSAHNDAVLPGLMAVFSAYGAESMLCLPLAIKGTPIGAVTLYDVRESRHFSPDEISLAQAIVLQAATAIENANLFRDLDTSLIELKATQARLVQAARLSAIGELAAVVAHQIDNPLTAVLGNTEFLMQDMDERDPKYEALATVHRAGKRAHAVVTRLLSVARQGTDQDRPERIDANATIRAVLELVTAHIQRDRVALTVEVEAAPAWIFAPPGQLEDVWLNLLLNARYAVLGISNPMVGISSWHEDEHVLVQVWDNGRGISAENQARIFDPFFTTKPSGEGTGLGLYICKQVIDRVGGSITVESTPGSGTRFVIGLPQRARSE